jgi:hypothetical protein
LGGRSHPERWPEGAGGNGSNSTNVLVWLQSVLPGVQKIVGQVDGAGISRDERQHLVLESDAEATDISRVIKTVP